jgi:hypothetical protein
MFSHLFLLNNNKYFLIYNNKQNYSLDDAINEYSKHNWILNNNLLFNSHIQTKYIRNSTFNKQLINDYSNTLGINNIYTNLGPINNKLEDEWSYYGHNYGERLKNPIIYKSKMLAFQ